MIVLLTNDDGIESPGLKAIREELTAEHEVWTVAPDAEKSGTSHSLTIKGAIRMRRIEERTFSLGGTPADCVLVSLTGAIPVKPDIVVSGINLGPNLGTDIIYSGTAAAARQAALMGCASIAVSMAASKPPFLFSTATRFVTRHIELFRSLWKKDHFLNINVPNVDSDPETEITFPSLRTYRDRLVRFDAPDGDMYFFLQGSLIETTQDRGSDWGPVSNGKVSVSPIFLHPINHHDHHPYQDAFASGMDGNGRL